LETPALSWYLELRPAELFHLDLFADGRGEPTPKTPAILSLSNASITNRGGVSIGTRNAVAVGSRLNSTRPIGTGLDEVEKEKDLAYFLILKPIGQELGWPLDTTSWYVTLWPSEAKLFFDHETHKIHESSWVICGTCVFAGLASNPIMRMRVIVSQ
jgi:hypothetical protein